MKFRVIYIHGNGGNNWRFAWAPWLKDELDKLGIESVFETMPDSELARKEFWMPHLEKIVDENTLLVGWSSGAVAAMRYAQKYHIYGSLLVAPCYTDLGDEEERLSGWYDEPWDWDAIKKHQHIIGLFSSSNDPLIPQREFIYIREQLNPDYVYSLDRGHFIEQTTFPELLECIKKLI